MKTVRILVALAAAVLFASCGPKTVIDGTLKDKADTPVVIKLLNVNTYQILDTVRTDAAGAFTYHPEIAEGCPEFIYLFYGDRKVASLLLSRGDHVKVTADTLGYYSVEGSEESVRLQEIEMDYAQFLLDMDRIASSGSADMNAELSHRYVDHYRRSVRYVMEHPKSLTVVPVLSQRVNDGLAVFDQVTDGILFKSICDSLKTVYPNSRYIKVLENESARRTSVLELDRKIREAEEVGYLDIDLPSMDGSSVKLSSVDAKVVMIYFWATSTEQNMFNLDALLPIYDDFHGRGFEIYAVALDEDKTGWATTVRNQQLPWVNVCDTRSVNSPYVGLYRISSLPTAFFMVDGEMDPNANVTDAASIRKYLQGKL